MDSSTLHYKERRRQLKEFNQKTKMVLNHKERNLLQGSLKEYHAYRQVDVLMNYLLAILDTPPKLDLLKDVRLMLPAAHVPYFDTLTPYDKMANPPPDFKKQVVPAMSVNGPKNGDMHYATLPVRRNVSKSVVYHSSTVPRNFSSSKGLIRSQSGIIAPVTHTPSTHGGNRLVKAPSMPSVPVVTPRLPSKRQNGGVPTVILNGSADGVNNESAPKYSVTLVKEPGQPLGFSIRGGSEHGLGIYVSEIDEGSPTDGSGLRVGDNIMEVNAVAFDNLASSSAVKVLTGSRRLKMVVRRVGKVPKFKFAREKTSWYDTSSGRIIEGEFEDHGTFHYPTGLSFVDSIERRIHMLLSRADQYLGFNIRGGSEYGLCIYVSKVDPGGLAVQKGLKVGDQIVAVNATSFDHITHANAVEILRSNATLVITVKDVGKYPSFKEIYAEYTWVDCGTGTISKSRSGEISSVPVKTPRPSVDVGRITREYPVETRVESRVESYAQTDPDETDEEASTTQISSHWSDSHLDTGVQTDDEFYKSRSLHQLNADSPQHDLSSVSTINTNSGMLLPHSRDLVLVEKSDQNIKAKKKETKSKEKSTWSLRKKEKAPRSTIGVMALQYEANPDLKTKKHSKTLERTSSLVEPGENNPRQAGSDDTKVKRSRTFREMLFGTKPREKGIDSKGRVKGKDRQALSSMNFSYNRQKDEEMLLYEGQMNDTVFAHGVGSQIMLQETMNNGSSHSLIENECKRLLQNNDEVKAVMRHVNDYERYGDIERLVVPLLAIFDTPEKMTLLRDIRGIIRPVNIGRFDSMVSQHELKAYEELAARNEYKKPLLHKEEDLIPPTKTLMAAVPDSRGQFKLQKQSEFERHTQKRQEIESGQRDRLVELRRKRNSIATDRVPFTGLPFVDNDTGNTIGGEPVSNREIIIPADPDSNYIATIHRHRSNSKIYMAKKDGLGGSEENLNVFEDDSDLILPAVTTSNYANSDLTTMTGRSGSSNSSVGSSGVAGMYAISAETMKSVRGDTTEESGVVLISSTPLHTPRGSLDNLAFGNVNANNIVNATDDDKSYNTIRSVEQVDDEGNFEEDEEDISALISAQDSTLDDSLTSLPFDISEMNTSKTEISSAHSSPRSARYGSYNVNPSVRHDEVVSPTRHLSPPVFTPPPPPDSPPPSARSSMNMHRDGETPSTMLYNYRDSTTVQTENDEDEGWREWLAVDGDATDIIDAPDMEDRCVGTTPRDSVSVISSRTVSSVNTAIYTNVRNEIHNNSVNNNNEALERMFDAEEIEYPLQSPSMRMTSARSSPIKHITDVSPSSDSGTLNSNFGDNSSAAGSQLHRSPSRNSVTSITSLRSALKAQKSSQSNNNLSQETPRRITISAERVSNENHSPETEKYERRHSNSNKSSYECNGSALKNQYSSVTKNHPGESPSKLSVSSVNSFTSNSTVPRSGYSDSTASPSRVYTIGFPVGGFGLGSRTNGYHSNSDDETATDITQSPSPIRNVVHNEQYAQEVYEEEDIVMVVLSKEAKSLGMSISGGSDSSTQPKVCIQSVYPGGAAALDGQLMPGMRLLSIDGHSMEGCTHQQAVDIIRRSYTNKRIPAMKIIAVTNDDSGEMMTSC